MLFFIENVLNFWGGVLQIAENKEWFLIPLFLQILTSWYKMMFLIIKFPPMDDVSK